MKKNRSRFNLKQEKVSMATEAFWYQNYIVSSRPDCATSAELFLINVPPRLSELLIKQLTAVIKRVFAKLHFMHQLQAYLDSEALSSHP